MEQTDDRITIDKRKLISLISQNRFLARQAFGLDEFKSLMEAMAHDVSEFRWLRDELAEARGTIRRLEARHTFEDIIFSGEEMSAVIEHARLAAGTAAPVLIRGESGTGKGLFAQAIHYGSSRRHARFVKVNCSSISQPGCLMFGQESFLDTLCGGNGGILEEAAGGTIFLDNIGDLGMIHQSKLLRIFREGESMRAGGMGLQPGGVRVIASAEMDLEQKIARGEFREDLFYQLTALPLFIPPLRLRTADIPKLTRHLAAKTAREFDRRVPLVSAGALEKLMSYNWPGNVRELENIIARAIITMPRSEDTILPEHIPQLQVFSCTLPQADLRQAMGEAGAGRVGNYTNCIFSVKGVGRFMPGGGAHPAIGEIGKQEEVEEERIEVNCADELVQPVLDAIRSVHPYEEPAIDIHTLDES